MAVSQRVEHVISAQGNDLAPLINRYAEAEQCPPVGLLAGLISESNLNEHAERIGSWPDWSEGLGQQTLLYANVGDHTASAANLKRVRDYYWQPDNAIREAARQYGAYYRQYQDHFEAWSRYNGGPRLAWANNPNKANIRRGWTAAQQYLAPEEAPMADHSFELGFADLATALGPETVGAPVTDEFPIGNGPDSGRGATLQVTTTGLMVYASGSGPRFLASQGQ